MAEKNVLTDNGLIYLWSLIKQLVSNSNKIESINVNGITQSITNKNVNINVPTNNNQLENGAGYQTSKQVQEIVNSALSGMTSIEYQKVDSLPTTGEAGVIYLVSHNHGEKDIFDEFIWISSENKFEKIGNTDIDLSGYQLSADLVEISNSRIDEICV